MKSSLGAAAAAVVVLLPLTASPASAHRTSLESELLENNRIIDAHVTTKVGNSICWSTIGTASHQIVSNQAFWKTKVLKDGDTSLSVPLRSAGTFKYHDALHPGLKGWVKVKIIAKGSAKSGWAITWTKQPSWDVSQHRVDVKVKGPGSHKWKTLYKNTYEKSVLFNPDKSGKYSFRVREDNLVNGKHSGWSPAKVVRIK